MTLEKFLILFISKLKNKNIQCCILRNYEGLPFKNNSNDIDFLILPEDLSKALKILFNLDGIRATGLIERPYVTSVFLNNVQWRNNTNSIQIDLVVMLSWKGLPFLSVPSVLSNAIPISGTKQLLKKPIPVHEAIISLFSSYLLGGWINEKYQNKVRIIFNNNKQAVLIALSSFLPKTLCFLILEGVISDNKNFLLGKLPEIRRSLILNNFKNKPLFSLKAMLRHFYIELKIRYTPYYIDTVCFLGTDGSGKSTVISCITAMLKGTTKEIKYKHLKPQLFKKGEVSKVVTAPHAKPPRSKFISTIKIISWLFLYWQDRFFHKHKSLTLRIWDRYYHDLLIDPLRYRYGAPMEIAHFLAKLVPKPDLFILLDAPTKVLQNRKQEVPFKETKRQRKAYLSLIGNMKNAVIIDTSQKLENVATDVYDEIINFLVSRAAKRMSER
ncbi:MAG: hypothetical protein H8D87_16990 [Deltaproteobacteria bacterium]|uniref:hypothetical protein n=1 Tax=Desulfobacula sp. TaxID=2593537 RepID=UPI0019C5A1E6|nr:hypothetical protein [Candidatus Desulfobacula maris]MBL6995761.1 hypothetical protein [Desulfobacula sp.]